MDQYVQINNYNLFVSTRGTKKNDAVLYIHGAPGIGVMDFIKFQGKNFGGNFFLVAPEQRGVWRSESVSSYNMYQIIDDYEGIRQYFDITSWTIISHCLGARIALEYYIKYSDSIDNIIFENPVIDSITPFREIIQLELKMILNKFGDQEYQKCIKNVLSLSTVIGMEQLSEYFAKKLNVNFNSFTMSKNTIRNLTKLKNEFNYNSFINSRETDVMMSKDTSLYSPLNKISIRVPILIMYGGKDITVPKSTLNILKDMTKLYECKKYPLCKHWIHIDEPSQYYNDVLKFLN